MVIQTSTLSNGLTIITDHFETVETVALGMWIKIGSRFETQKNNGISHVLEHMAFRGTTTLTAQEISEKIEAVGGHLNAYTSREATAYYARVLHQDVPLALSILTDILQNSIFDEQELEREKNVILQEIHQTHDSPDDLAFDHLQQVAYPDQAFGRPITGYAEIVSQLTRTDIQDYMQQHYIPSQMYFAAAGKVNHDFLVKYLQDHFQANPGKPSVCEAAQYVGGDVRTEKTLEQVHLVLAFSGVDLKSSDYYAALVLATLLGGGMSSRLFQEVREKRGLAYGIQAFSSAATDSGLFGVYTSAEPDNIKELLPVVCEELLKLSSTLQVHEIIRAKNQIKASVLMGLESTSSRCRQLAMQTIIYGHVLSIKEITSRIDQVQLADLARLAQQIFSSKPSISAVGPLTHLMSYDKICNYLNKI